MSKIGYVRVSTADQNLDRQLNLMEDAHVEKVFEDKASGKNTQRVGFQKLMAYLRPGDELHVESFSRLSRNTTELLSTVEKLNANGITLVSHKEQLDTGTPSGKLMLTVIGAIAQFEREITLERQKEGIAIAKQKGVYHGRKRMDDSPELLLALENWATGKLTAKDAIRISGVSKRTFYNRANDLGFSRCKFAPDDEKTS